VQSSAGAISGRPRSQVSSLASSSAPRRSSACSNVRRHPSGIVVSAPNAHTRTRKAHEPWHLKLPRGAHEPRRRLPAIRGRRARDECAPVAPSPGARRNARSAIRRGDAAGSSARSRTPRKPRSRRTGAGADLTDDRTAVMSDSPAVVAAPNSEPDPELTATLPLSGWVVVMRHLGGGAYRDVADVVERLKAQLMPQEFAAAIQSAATAPDPDSTKRAH
jgi:hypothetical protein